jgi:hypothetical protein
MMQCQPCTKEVQLPAGSKHNFIQPVNVYPYNKYYKVGDTIWLEVKTGDKTLYDTIQQKRILADSLALIFSVQVSQRYLSPPSTNILFCHFTDTFNLHAVFNNNGYNQGLNFYFGCNTDTVFSFKFGIILIHAGIFSFDLSSNNISPCFPDFPNSLRFSTINYIFNLSDCNKDIYLSIPVASRGESSPGYTTSLIDQKQVFVFQVQ